MSKQETPLTRAYWQRIGGTLIEEFPIPDRDSSTRYIDGVIIPDGPFESVRSADLAGKDVIVVQTKAARLGMSLIGQAVVSKILVEERFGPRSCRAVAICTRSDEMLSDVVSRHFPFIEIEVAE